LKRRPNKIATTAAKSPRAGKSGAGAGQAFPAPRSRGREWAFRMAALSLLPFLLVILEVGLRIGGYGYPTQFFLPLKIGNENFLVPNEAFALRYFPPETSRKPEPQRMRAVKPPGAVRIFVFGESAALGDPEPAYGASRYLQVLLRERFPRTEFEVINVAFTAINSHVILPIAHDCAREQGDIWIVYMGNNEMVGPFGAATIFGAQAPPRWVVKVVTGIQRTRTGQWLTAALRKVGGRSARASSWKGMEMFLENRVPPGSGKKEPVYRNFAQNLDDILEAGLDAHTKIILNTVAVNLKDSPPFASLANSNLPAATRVERDASLTRARREAEEARLD
jgi:hypothetical protein